MTTWNVTEPPPKDGRRIVLMGGIFVQDEIGCFKDPVLVIAHFSSQSGLWLGDDDLSIRGYLDSELQCYAWSEIPDRAGSPIIVLEEMPKGTK